MDEELKVRVTTDENVLIVVHTHYMPLAKHVPSGPLCPLIEHDTKTLLTTGMVFNITALDSLPVCLPLVIPNPLQMTALMSGEPFSTRLGDMDIANDIRWCCHASSIENRGRRNPLPGRLGPGWG